MKKKSSRELALSKGYASGEEYELALIMDDLDIKYNYIGRSKSHLNILYHSINIANKRVLRKVPKLVAELEDAGYGEHADVMMQLCFSGKEYTPDFIVNRIRSGKKGKDLSYVHKEPYNYWVVEYKGEWKKKSIDQVEGMLKSYPDIADRFVMVFKRPNRKYKPSKGKDVTYRQLAEKIGVKHIVGLYEFESWSNRHIK